MKNIKLDKASGLYLPIIIIVLSQFSCKEYLTIDPPTDQISTSAVFDSDEGANAAMNGIYTRMASTGLASGGINDSMPRIAGLSSDELVNYDPLNYIAYFDHSLLPTSQTPWNQCYFIIYSTNSILENLNKSNNVSLQMKRKLEGEAKFIRAFYYFYLTNLYGDIPLHLTTDYRANNSAARIQTFEVYNQIIKDLSEANDLLGEEYLANERIRPNKWAATAMLARVYLYTKNWLKAEELSSAIIANTSKFILTDDLNSVFLKNSTESIWQLMPVGIGRNTNEALLFILNNTPSTVSLNETILSAFEPGDNRKIAWIRSITANGRTFYYSYKYKITSVGTTAEYSMILRLAEQYLIRAESKIQQDRIQEGILDLNVLRKRARAFPTSEIPNPLPDLSPNLSKSNALLAIEKERRIELLTEWGHRWLDLKRTERVDAVIGALKGSLWQKSDALFPIPQTERNANPNITQNDGY